MGWALQLLVRWGSQAVLTKSGWVLLAGLCFYGATGCALKFSGTAGWALLLSGVVGWFCVLGLLWVGL